jgi:flagellar hook-associated protein FlgK
LSRTLQVIYQGNLWVLLQRRNNLVAEIEAINKQIAELKSSARKDNIRLDEIR